MRVLAFLALAGLLCVSAMADSPSQPSPSVAANEDGGYTIQWFGVAGRTYFLQVSTDLENWAYADVIESGANENISYEVGSTGDNVFFRLEHTDQQTIDVAAGDFDGDGLSNQREIELGLDPLNWDSNGNTVPDGIEVAYGLTGLPGGVDIHNYGVDTDGDGISHGLEVDLGTNPEDSNDFPLQIISVNRLANMSFNNATDTGFVYSSPSWAPSSTHTNITSSESAAQFASYAESQSMPDTPDVANMEISTDGTLNLSSIGVYQLDGEGNPSAIATTNRVWVKTKASSLPEDRKLGFFLLGFESTYDATTQETPKP